MPWKFNEDGSIAVNPETQNPIWIGTDNSEAPFDKEERDKRVAELTKQNRQRGEELETMRGKLSSLEGVDDIPAFVAQAKQDAEDKVSLKDKDRDYAETMNRRVQEAVKTAIEPRDSENSKLKAENEGLRGQLNQSVIGNAFLSSKYLAENCPDPVLAKELLAKGFRVNAEGKIQAFDPETGDIMYGESGAEASFDEAISVKIAKSPFRIAMSPSPSGGSGTQSSTGSSKPGTPSRYTDCKTQEQKRAYLENDRNLAKAAS